MGRVGVAFRLFFKALGDGAFAEQAGRLADGKPAIPSVPPSPPAPGATAPAAPVRREPVRSAALDLLAVLQREGRLIDFLKEDLTAYNDAQIGAAVRDVHRDSATALERMFALRRVRPEAEGASIELPVSFDAARVRLTGNIAGNPPYLGALRHAGWQATKIEVPEWSGSPDSMRVVAPAEVEIS